MLTNAQKKFLYTPPKYAWKRWEDVEENVSCGDGLTGKYPDNYHRILAWNRQTAEALKKKGV